ncbi:uncharacterized protein LOC143585296 [Bidens hawaiensis]|uniref:uncharacterized protein LOC143585296 n=1 Tax=Bidens hawaiensis TaxID=980011 RepID=UPI00404AAE34
MPMIGDETTGFTPKAFTQYSKEKKKALEIETKAYSTLTMALPDNIFHQVGNIKICETVEEMLTRFNHLVREMNKLKMEPSESNKMDTSSSKTVSGENWIMDGGCSRYITENFNLLTNVKNIQGGYVAFAGNLGGMITKEGDVSNGCITFEKVNYRDKVDHNFLSMSLICDKKYTTVFNDKERIIMKPGYIIPEDMVVM